MILVATPSTYIGTHGRLRVFGHGASFCPGFRRRQALAMQRDWKNQSVSPWGLTPREARLPRAHRPVLRSFQWLSG
jgi:hypothetical protein